MYCIIFIGFLCDIFTTWQNWNIWNNFCIINIFLSLKVTQVEHVFQGILLPMAVVVLVFTALRMPGVRAWLDNLLARLAGKVLRQGQENAVLLIDYIGQDSIAQVMVRHVPEYLQDVTLAESGLRAKENLLVLDATTGQNAVNQAEQFKQATGITGIILTKLDGTAKGGVVLAIRDGMGIPVKYIGVGEQVDDLQPFNAQDFARALFGEE